MTKIVKKAKWFSYRNAKNIENNLIVIKIID